MTDDTRRLTRRELYNLVWTQPVDSLAKELGMSGRGLGKLCERHSIPVPPRGYWARKVAGQRVKRETLIELADSQSSEIAIDLTLRSTTSLSNNSDASTSPYCELFERQLKEIGILAVPNQLRNPHSVIADCLRREDIERQQARNFPYARQRFNGRFSSYLARRRVRILNTLFKELERRGCKIEKDASAYDDFAVRLGRDSVKFSIVEKIRQFRRRLTEEERTSQSYSNRQWTQIREQTGELTLKLDCYMPKGVPHSWQDELDRPLESKAPELLAGILTALARVRQQREERDADERCRMERQEEERRREADRQAELDRTLGLRQRAKAWQVASHIRGYVAAVRKAVEIGDIQVRSDELEAWCCWALAHAIDVDPLHSNGAVETSLLWKQEQTSHSEYGWAQDRRPSEDPDWFWGRRWQHKD